MVCLYLSVSYIIATVAAGKFSSGKRRIFFNRLENIPLFPPAIQPVPARILFS